MRGLRRAALAIGIGAIFAAALRLRGSGGSPPQQGEWRELTEPDLRDAHRVPSGSAAVGDAAPGSPDATPG